MLLEKNTEKDREKSSRVGEGEGVSLLFPSALLSGAFFETSSFFGGERKAGELSGRCCVDVDLDGGEEEEEESHSPVHKAHTHTSSRGRRKVSWNITKKKLTWYSKRINYIPYVNVC